MNITITPSARKFMRRMVMFGAAGGEGAGLRLVVSAGGCSGLSAEFSVEAAPQGGDAVLELEEVRVFLPAESRLLLEGVTVDFLDSAMSSGLSFVNPNASSCACSGAAPNHSGMGTVTLASISRKA